MTPPPPGDAGAPSWHDVAAFDDLDSDFPLGVEIEGQHVGVFRQGDEVYALENVCPHAYALLSQGFLEGGVIECPLHAAQFEVATGRCLNEIGQRDLACHSTKIEAGRVLVMLKPVS